MCGITRQVSVWQSRYGEVSSVKVLFGLVCFGMSVTVGSGGAESGPSWYGSQGELGCVEVCSVMSRQLWHVPVRRRLLRRG